MSDELVVLPVPMTRDDREKVKEAAKAAGKNSAELVRELLSEYIQSQSESSPIAVPKHGGARRNSGGNRRKPSTRAS